jgi:very-short-patch-repair endonuclease
VDAEAKLASVALPQNAVFTRGQAVEAGFSPRTVDRRVAGGTWLRLHAGVYVPASVAVTWKHRLAGACLACGPLAVASHRSAVTVWGLADDLFAPEVTVPSGAKRRHRGITVHESDLVERSRHQDFPVTPPMRTLVDAAGCVPPDRLSRMVDTALRRRLVYLEPFRSYVDRPEHRRRPGSGVLRDVLSLRTPGRPIGSDAETVLFDLLRDAGLPLPQPQYAVRTRRGRRFIDFAYPDAKIAIEVDGFEVHGAREAFESDRPRQNEIELLGFHVYRFTWEQLTKRPVDTVVTIGIALGLRPTKWRR